MKIVQLLSCWTLASTVLASLDSAGVGPEENDGRWLVSFKPGAKANVENAVRNANGNVRKEFDDIKVIAVSLPNQQAADALEKRKDVEYVEADFRRYLMAETTPYGVDRVQAKDVWNATANPSKGQGVVVCIIDGGMSLNHEDLADVSIANANPYSEWGFDGCNHGTHVAGTVAAQINGVGVVGVAPDASLYIERVFQGPDCDWTYVSDLIGALEECKLGGASVVSMSLGGGGYSQSEQLAFEQAFNEGVLSVASAGNSGTSAFSYPASYPSVMSVAATDSNNEIAYFSQYNSEVDIAAPGVDVLSTVIDAGFLLEVWLDPAQKTQLDNDPLEGSGQGSATGALLNMRSACLSTDDWTQASGKIVHCRRDGVTTFREMVDNAVANGGIGVIISNTEDTLISGTLSGSVSVPVTGVSLSSRSLLEASDNYMAAMDFDAEASEYSLYSGTSMATPHVSAVAALLLSAKPGASVTQVRDCIEQTALDLGDEGRDDYFGHGLVQASAAHSCLIGTEFTTRIPATTSTSTTTTTTTSTTTTTTTTTTDTPMSTTETTETPTSTTLTPTSTSVTTETLTSTTETPTSTTLTPTSTTETPTSTTTTTEPPLAVCGNGWCLAPEDCRNCPEDCAGKVTGKPSLRYCCIGGDSVDDVVCDGFCQDVQCHTGATEPPATTDTPATTETPVCLEVGHSCDKKAECCSNKCRKKECFA